ncbi:MAG: potassium transporter TrkH [Lachnospiraceae bacterium]|nr:potassium transporter TrkH [Lachnospiraceae bacterium]
MKKHLFTSVQMIPLSFLSAIVIGTILLMLPISSVALQWTPFVDALFSAATSVCVTGLTVLDTATYWSLFGQIVILILIQIGGLGIITVVTLIMMATQKKLSFGDRLMLSDALNVNKTTGILKLVLRIIKATVIVELAGAVIYATQLVPKFGVAKGLWASLFNSVSAFCNAGMDIMGNGSMMDYRDNPVIMTVTILLIVLGGLGYVLWFDVADKTVLGIKKRYNPFQIIKRFSEHTKLVLCLTGGLLACGFIIFFATEYNNPETLGDMGLGQKIVNAFFESVTLRTAGFSSFPQEGLRDISCVFAYIFMFIGGSPIGTAGGVKTVTFFLAILNVTSFLHGKDDAKILKKTVTSSHMRKATVIVSVSITVVLALTVLLVVTNHLGIIDSLFEIVSATATVGLTRGATSLLNVGGKLIVTIAMYLGRIAPISMAIFLTGNRRDENRIIYPEGKFYIG